MRRRPAPRVALRASRDRWLFGYADVVTLLFACFASLYAARVGASADVAPAVTAAPAAAPKAVPPVPPAPRAALASAAPTDLEVRLSTALADEHVLPGVDVTGSQRGLVISLPEAGSFPPGRAEFSDEGRRVIRGLAATLRDLPNLVRVEGHTDNVPIHNGLFASNWDLSTARATRVVQFLIEECGLDSSRLSAAGYADQRPRLPNDSPGARARNRRVDVVVLDAAAATLEAPGRVVR